MTKNVVKVAFADNSGGRGRFCGMGHTEGERERERERQRETGSEVIETVRVTNARHEMQKKGNVKKKKKKTHTKGQKPKTTREAVVVIFLLEREQGPKLRKK